MQLVFAILNFPDTLPAVRQRGVCRRAVCRVGISAPVEAHQRGFVMDCSRVSRCPSRPQGDDIIASSRPSVMLCSVVSLRADQRSGRRVRNFCLFATNCGCDSKLGQNVRMHTCQTPLNSSCQHGLFVLKYFDCSAISCTLTADTMT